VGGNGGRALQKRSARGRGTIQSHVDYKSLSFVGDRHSRPGVSLRLTAGVFPPQLPVSARKAAFHGGIWVFPIADGGRRHMFDRDQQKYVLYLQTPKNGPTTPQLVGVLE